jgi:hypothetical protein
MNPLNMDAALSITISDITDSHQTNSFVQKASLPLYSYVRHSIKSLLWIGRLWLKNLSHGLKEGNYTLFPGNRIRICWNSKIILIVWNNHQRARNVLASRLLKTIFSSESIKTVI